MTENNIVDLLHDRLFPKAFAQGEPELVIKTARALARCIRYNLDSNEPDTLHSNLQTALRGEQGRKFHYGWSSRTGGVPGCLHISLHDLRHDKEKFPGLAREAEKTVSLGVPEPWSVKLEFDHHTVTDVQSVAFERRRG